jgi:glycosyltransferase involved in cell wall biosynthesis
MDSVLAQSYRPVEIVVVDDGSTDNTEQLMSEYKDKVRYYRQKNRGVAVARTAGCRLADGEFIAFQDDDDIMVKDRIELLYDSLLSHPSAIFSSGDRSVIDEFGNEIGEIKGSELLKGKQVPVYLEDGYRAVLMSEVDPVPHTTLFRKLDGERIGWFDRRFFHACEDTDFYWRLARLGAIVYVPDIVSYYRKGHQSLISNRLLWQYSRFLLFEKHLQMLAKKEKQFKKVLQRRLRRTIENIVFLAADEATTPELITSDLIKRGEELLGLKDYLLHRWAIDCKIPLRRKLHMH